MSVISENRRSQTLMWAMVSTLVGLIASGLGPALGVPDHSYLGA